MQKHEQPNSCENQNHIYFAVSMAPADNRQGHQQTHSWISWAHIYHYSDVIMGMMAAQITSLSIVYSTLCSGADPRKHQSSALLAFVRGIHRWPVNSPHKGPVSWKKFPFDDVIMQCDSSYNTINFLPKPHQRHPIARRLGRDMGYLLWFQTLFIYCPCRYNVVYNIMLQWTAS